MGLSGAWGIAAEPAPLVRSAEFDQLRRLTDSRDRHGRLIAVVGEPGSGKTHLLAALVREQQWTASPAIVHQWARGDADAVNRASLDTVWALARGGQGGSETAAAADGARQRPGPRRPLVVMDDVHLADPATLQELCAIAYRQQPPQADLVISFRPRQLPTALTVAIQLGQAERIELRPLTGAQMTELSASPVPYELRQRSGGNPFNLRALKALDEAARSGSDASVVPFDVAMLAETGALTRTERGVLQAASILRTQFDADLLAEVTELDADAVAAGLRGLVKRDLVRMARGSRRFAVRDEVTGILLRRIVDPDRAAAVHRRAARALAARGITGRELCFHLVSSAPGVNAEDLAQIVDAAVEVMDTNISECVAWLTTVIAEAPPTAGTGPADAGVRARLALVRAFARTGRITESRNLIFALRELAAGSVDETALADLVALVTTAESVLSADTQTVGMLERQLARDSLRGSPAWARLVMARGFRQTILGLAPDQREVKDALARPGSPAAGLTTAGLLGLRALFCVAVGAVNCGDQDAKTAGAMLERSPEGELADHLDALFLVALASLYLGCPDRARRLAERGVAVGRRWNRNFILPALLVLLSESARQVGQLEQAQQAADDAIMDSEPGNSLRLAQAIALKSAARVWAEPSGARSARLLAQQALAQQAPGQGTVDGSASVAALALAQAVWLEGDSGYCVTLLLNEGGGADLGNLPMAYRNAVWELLCAAGNDAGMPIEDWAAYSAGHAARFPTSRNLAYDDLTRGHLHRAQSSLAKARQGYQSGAKRFAAAKMPIERSYALGHAAHALSLLGLEDQAEHTAGIAVAIARQARAGTLEAWLQRQIAAPTRMPDQFGQLTHREREIAVLVCSGIRRREIATQLSISIRTVDVHLTRIYRKTGVTSRMELAVALNRPAPLAQAVGAERAARLIAVPGKPRWELR